MNNLKLQRWARICSILYVYIFLRLYKYPYISPFIARRIGIWLFLQIGGVLFVGVLIMRVLLFWVYIGDPDFIETSIHTYMLTPKPQTRRKALALSDTALVSMAMCSAFPR